MSADAASSPSGAQTLLNGLHVIREVADGARTQTEIQQDLALPRSTVSRLVAALRAEEFLRQSDDGLVLGPALISLGFAALSENSLTEVSRPILAELSREVQDTVHLAVDEQGSVLYLAKIEGTRGAETRSRVGLRMPLTRTGIGKALLLDRPDSWRRLFLEEAPAALPKQTSGTDADAFVERMGWYRDLGFSLDIEENEPGIRCVAAPVRDARGELCAAISVTATTPYMPVTRMRSLVPVVTRFAARIGVAIGNSGASSANSSPAGFSGGPEAAGRAPGHDGSAAAALMDQVFSFE